MSKRKSSSKIHPGYKTRKYPTPYESRGRKRSSTKRQKKTYNRARAVTLFVFGLLLLVSMLIGFSPILEQYIIVKKAIIMLMYAMGLYYYIISS